MVLLPYYFTIYSKTNIPLFLKAFHYSREGKTSKSYFDILWLLCPYEVVFLHPEFDICLVIFTGFSSVFLYKYFQ